MAGILSDEAKVAVQAEEVFRQEVRAEIESKRIDSRPNWLRFLNSALGLWLLSTIVASSIGTAYALAKESWDKSRTLQAEQRKAFSERMEAISRLDLEISFRISNLLTYVDEKYIEQLRDQEAGKPPQPVTKKRISLILQVPPDQSVQYNYPSLSLYQEYHSTTLLSLVAELSRLQQQQFKAEAEMLPKPGPEGISVSETDLKDLATLMARISNVDPLFRERAGTEAINGELLGGAIHKHFLLPRWRQTYFPYVDCSEKTPFC